MQHQAQATAFEMWQESQKADQQMLQAQQAGWPQVQVQMPQLAGQLLLAGWQLLQQVLLVLRYLKDLQLLVQLSRLQCQALQASFERLKGGQVPPEPPLGPAALLRRAAWPG